MNKKLCIIIFLALSLFSCKSKSGGTDPTAGETRLLKIKAPVSYDSSIHIDMKVMLGERVYEAGELANGVNIPINSSVDVILETDTTSFVFWSGRAITDENRRLKNFSLLIEEDTYLRVAVSSINIETRKLDVLVGNNGQLLVNDEKYEGYNTIFFADGQIVDLEVVPDDGYFFAGWSGDIEASYEKKRNITMGGGDASETNSNAKLDKYVQVDFSDNVSVKLEIGEFENGTVLINGNSFDKNKEYIFNVGDWVTIEAKPNNNFSFLAWAGTISSIESKHSFQIESDISVKPKFGAPNGVAALTITPSGVGNKVSYTVTRGGVAGPATEVSDSFNIIYYNDGALEEGDIITLKSTSAEGFLDGATWAGDGPSEESTIKEFTMGSDSKGITATFKRKATKLTVKVVRQYDKDNNGTLVEETDPITGFSFTIENSGWKQEQKKMNVANVEFNETSNPKNPNYGDTVKITADSGTYYTLRGIQLNTASTENVNSKTFDIKADTVVTIYLKRKEHTLTLIINGGYYNNATTGTTLQSKVNIKDTGLVDVSGVDYLATTSPSTTYNNIRVLSGKTLTLTATGTAARSFKDYTGDTINNITANATVNANFTNNKVNLTYNAKRLWTNDANYEGVTPNSSVDITGANYASVGGYSRKINGTSILSDVTTSHVAPYDYGTALTLGVVVDSTKFNTTISRVVEGSVINGSETAITSVILEGSKTVTALIYHKIEKFNFQISGNGLSTSVIMSNSGTYADGYSLTCNNYSSSKAIPVISGLTPLLTAVAGDNNIFKGYASGLTAKRLTVYKPSSKVNLNAEFVYSMPWTGGRTQPHTDASGWYLIYTPEELAWLDQWDKNTLDNKKVKVMNDINMANNSSFKGINTGVDDSTPITGFNFDGQSYEIANLNIKSDGEYYALIGVMRDSTIKNVSTSGSIEAKAQVAGIVAYLNTGIIFNCYNNADVTATKEGTKEGDLSRPGGIASYILRATLSGCYNAGNIISKADGAGGIVAVAHASSVQDSYNSGYIEAVLRAGGIAGQYEKFGDNTTTTKMTRLYNFGTVVVKTKWGGGIVGHTDMEKGKGSLEYSYNIGSVSGNTIGSIVGYNKNGISLVSCYYVGTSGGSGTPKTAGEFASLHSSLGQKWKAFNSPFNVVNGVSVRPVLIGVGEGAIAIP